MITTVLLLLFLSTSNLADGRRPRCRDAYTVAWWEYPPYIYTNQDNITGIFPELIRRMIDECCQAGVNVTFSYSLANKGQAVNHVINGSADLVLPLIVKTGKTKFLNLPFISFVDSPGIAFYSAAPTSAGDTLIKIIFSSFPVLMVTLVLTLIAGAVFWLLESVPDAKVAPTMFSGVFNGIWWAFVSMTTVGYGDLTPKHRSTQIFSMIWILIGIVAVSLFTATVTAVLTMSCLSSQIDLRGNEIAVIEGSPEHALAIRGSSMPVGCDTVPDLVNSLQAGKAIGVLLDSYVAGYYQQLFNKFRLNDLREDLFSYGVVLKPNVIKNERCFRDFFHSRQDQILEIVSANIFPLKQTTHESAAEEMSKNMFDIDSFAVHGPIGIGFCFIFILYLIFYLKDTFFATQNISKRKPSVVMDTAEQKSRLRRLGQCHTRELTSFLHKLHQESKLFQDTCDAILQRAESRNNFLPRKPPVQIETVL